MPVGDSACIELKHANPNAVSAASAPPATTASASPYWIIRSAAPIAWAPLEQAETTPYIWPWRPCFIETAAAPALGMYCGIPSGETIFAPSVAHHVVLGLDGLDAADPGRDHAADPHRVVRQLAVPAGLLDRLVGGDQRELGEAVEPADLLDRQEAPWARSRVQAPAPSTIPHVAGGPALVQGARADRRAA